MDTLRFDRKGLVIQNDSICRGIGGLVWDLLTISLASLAQHTLGGRSGSSCMEPAVVLHRIALFARDIQDMLWRLVFEEALVAGCSREGGLSSRVDLGISLYIIQREFTHSVVIVVFGMRGRERGREE